MRKLDHCNIVRLRYFFYSSGEKVRVHVADEALYVHAPTVAHSSPMIHRHRLDKLIFVLVH